MSSAAAFNRGNSTYAEGVTTTTNGVGTADGGESKVYSNENCLTRCVAWGLEAVEEGFGSFGKFTARYPWTVILVSSLICGLCSIGFLRFETESRPEELWVLQGTEALTDEDYVSSVWNNRVRFNLYYATARGGVSITSPAAIQRLYDLHQRVLVINVSASSNTDEFPGKWDYERACLRTGDTCATTTVLDLFDYDEAVIASLTEEEIIRRINNDSFYVLESGREFSKDDIIGFDGDGNIRAYRGVYVLDEHAVERDGERTDVVGEPWEAEGIDIFRGDNSPLETFPQFASSWSEEFGRAIEQDSNSLTIAFIIIIVYLFLTLGRRDKVDCMMGLSMTAVISIGMALAASWGLASAFGEFYSPLHGIIPFLLVGLGVDDAFILVTHYQQALEKGDKGTGYEEAIEMAMRTGGMSILITSLTDFLAFAIGSTTNIPALSSFCVYAGLGVVFDFFFQVTFFMACLTLDARRAHAKRLDIALCCKDGDEVFQPYRSPARGFCCLRCKAVKQDVSTPVFREYGKLLMTWPARIGVLMAFLTLIGLSSFGVNQMETNFRADWFLPPDSYLRDSIDVANEFFTQTTVFDVYIKDIDYFARQEELNSVGRFLTSSREVVPETSDFWYSGYLSWAAETQPYSSAYNASINAVTNATLFYTGLQAFLNSSEGERFGGDIQFIDDMDPVAGIFATRSAAQIGQSEFSGTGQERYEAMQNLRSDLSDAMNYDDARVFATEFIFWERFGFIREELVKNLGIALGVMATIVFLLLYSAPVVFSVVMAIGATVLDVFGLAYFWGVQINFVVTIFLLIAVGLSVDYSAHIGHAFKEARGPADERARKALLTTGPPVFNAIFSTFLAILVLANAQTYVFQVFFQMFTLTTVLGGFHGLVVLPVVLSFLGGDSLDEDDNGIEKFKGAAAFHGRNSAHPESYPAKKRAGFDMWAVKGRGDSKINGETEMAVTVTQQEILAEAKAGIDDGNDSQV